MLSVRIAEAHASGGIFAQRGLSLEVIELFSIDFVPDLFDLVLNQIQLASLAASLINRVAVETLRLYLQNSLGQKLGIVDPMQLEKLFAAQSKLPRYKLFQIP